MSGPLTEALGRWKGGDNDAQYDLLRELQPLVRELIRLVQQRRASDLQQHIDSHGVVNAALKSFFSGARKADKFPVLRHTQDVRRILYTLVLRSLGDEIDFHHAEKRDTRQARPIASVSEEERQAPPDASNALAEWLEEATARLYGVHPMAIDILKLAIDGLSNNDIATELDLSLRAVQHIRQRTYKAWHDSQLE